MLFAFPEYNIWSVPLLVLVCVGLVFVVLIFSRAYKERRYSDFLLGTVILIMCYHRTTYTIGFMAWYDTFRNTKINYCLISMMFAFGPLLYLYVKSVTSSNFKFQRSHLWHFAPQILYTLYRLFIFGYDAAQPDFGETQNGILMQKIENSGGGLLFGTLNQVWTLLYLAFTIQLYYQYRKKIKNFFSNTYRFELNWLLAFLGIHSFLYFYDLIQSAVLSQLFELGYTNKWWYHLLSALVIVLLGVWGYFTKTDRLRDIEFNTIALPESEPSESKAAVTEIYEVQKRSILKAMEEERYFLDPDLSLKSLAQNLRMTPGQLSEVINNGFLMNFNDFINKYRVEAVKSKIDKGDHAQWSLLGIAMDCGFSSKATFNRVFKKFEGVSPSAYSTSVHSEN